MSLAIPEDLADRISQLAETENRTLYAETADLLKTIARVAELGIPSKKVLSYCRFVATIKIAEGAPLYPTPLLGDMIAKLFATEKTWLLRRWYDYGRALGMNLRHTYPEMGTLIEDFADSGPVSKINLVRTPDRQNEFTFELAASIRRDQAECVSSFWQGIASSYGLIPEDAEVNEGLVWIRLKYLPERARLAARKTPIMEPENVRATPTDSREL